MINTKNFRTSINGDEPEMIKVSFPGSKKLKHQKMHIILTLQH